MSLQDSTLERLPQFIRKGHRNLSSQHLPHGVAVNQNCIRFPIMEPLVKQSADGGLARPGQAGEKVYGSLVHLLYTVLSVI